MRFRLGTTGGQQAADGIGRALNNIFMAPVYGAQGAEEAQQAKAKGDLMAAQTALYGQKAEAQRQQLERGSVTELLKNAALQQGVAPHQLDEFSGYATTGQLPGQYVAPADGVGPTLPRPSYADPDVGRRIFQTLGITQNALAQGDKSVENVAKAALLGQKQTAIDAMAADPAQAPRYGQAFAASEGKALVDNIGNTGRGFNKFTGQGGTLEAGLSALYDQGENAQTFQRNASGQASLASARHSDAGTRKINQELEQGQRTGDLQVVTGQDGAITVVNKRTLTAQPVLDAQGRPVVKGAAGGGGKALTEGQAKANLFGGRMMEAGAVLDEMEKQGVMRPGLMKQSAEGIARAVPILGPDLSKGAGAVMNWTQSDAQQSVEQAQRDFINAVLRRESGAAISQGEFDNAFQQYFPQPGDSKKVIEQKRRNRQIATTLMLQEVPEAQRYRLGQTPASAPAVPVAPAQAGGATGSWGPPAAPAGWSIQKVN